MKYLKSLGLLIMATFLIGILNTSIMVAFAKTNPHHTLKSEKALGYIKKVYQKNGQYYLDIDYALWFSGQEAYKKATEDGQCQSKQNFWECVPGGFYIRNKNPKIRTFQIAKNADVRMQTFSHTADGNFNYNEKISVDTFKGIISGTIIPVEFMDSERYINYFLQLPFHIQVSKGVITNIQEQYLP